MRMKTEQKPEWQAVSGTHLRCGVFTLFVEPVQEGTAWEWSVQFLDRTHVSVTDAVYATAEQAQVAAIDWMALRLRVSLSDMGQHPFAPDRISQELEKLQVASDPGSTASPA